MKMITTWFNFLQSTIIKYGIHEEDIYNFDETGFALGLTATAKVVTRTSYGRRSLLQPGNREWVTTIEAISASGYALPPCVIFKGKVFMKAWFGDTDLPATWLFAVSEKGWTTDSISLEWLQKVFIPSSIGRTKGVYRLLVLDGHGSHLTPQFDEICAQNNIITICMPAHSSHLLQPLDIGCFGVLKRAYSEVVESQTRLGIHRVDKNDFLEAYTKARIKAFTEINIVNSFASAGIRPFDPQRVISKLDIRLATPPRPPSNNSDSSRNWTPKTPYTVKEAKRQASSIKKLASNNPARLEEALDQMEKGCQLAIHSFMIARQQISDLLAANAKTTRKKRRTKARMANNGALLVSEAIERVGGPGQVEEAIHEEPGGSSPTPNPTNERRPQRCSLCKTPGHKRNRCPERSE
jgi:hypothetical protein